MTKHAPTDLAALALDLMTAAGADAADVLVVERTAISAGVRLGAVETVERDQGLTLGLRALIGRRQAVAATGRTDRASLQEAAERAVAMARAAPEDPYAGLAEAGGNAEAPALDLDDGGKMSPDGLIAWSQEAEAAARAVPGVTNSEGAEASASRTTSCFLTSTGLQQVQTSTGYAVSASVLAGQGETMVRDYDFARRRHAADMPEIAGIGRAAGERAVARTGARKIASAAVPVMFEARAARSLLGHLAAAVSGPAVARGTSFLKGRMGQRLFPDAVTVMDDPWLTRGLASRALDGEGIATRRRALIDSGRLTGWLLNLSSARQLDLPPTGNAQRGLSAPPSAGAHNLLLQPGRQSPDELIRETGRGFLVTELIGMGVNPVTGDYSRGAAGFWIEQGARAYPVHEVTIAGNLVDMFANLTPADDLIVDGAICSPTVRIEGMTLAGE